MISNKISNLWFKLSDKIRFIIVGCCNFVVSYIIYSLIVYFGGESLYQISLALSWLITSVISFTTQRLFVFPVKGNLFKQYLKCCVTWFFSYLINAFLLEIFVKHFSWNVYIAQILANSSAAVFTYIMFKIFAFKNKTECV